MMELFKLHPGHWLTALLAALFLWATAHASSDLNQYTPRGLEDLNPPRKFSNWPIKKGYVAFGDSYGAGMGTGVTTTDACRVGSNNFADLLVNYTNDPTKIDYQRHVCSGDTTTGINRQLKDLWKNPENADIATVSAGGNDVFFSSLVNYCVVTFNPFSTGGGNRKECLKYQGMAKKVMTDSGENGLHQKLVRTYKRILEKGRDDIHVFVTSYVPFFNEEDSDCDKTTFYWWYPHWGGNNPKSGQIRLTKDLRRELNDLVKQLNSVISSAVEEVNKGLENPQVHYVDMWHAWGAGNHRWCEAGGKHEPDQTRQETYFFLCGWDDVKIGDQKDHQLEQDITDLEQLLPGINLPDADTCEEKLDTDGDPWDLWKCHTARFIKTNPDSNAAKSLPKTEKYLKSLNAQVKVQGIISPVMRFTILSAAAIAAREEDPDDINANHVPSYYPTRQIKAFHPRSTGQLFYRNQLMAAIGRAFHLGYGDASGGDNDDNGDAGKDDGGDDVAPPGEPDPSLGKLPAGGDIN